MKSILAIIVGHALTLSARFSQLDTTETLVRMASILSIGLVLDNNLDNPSKKLVKICINPRLSGRGYLSGSPKCCELHP